MCHPYASKSAEISLIAFSPVSCLLFNGYFHTLRQINYLAYKYYVSKVCRLAFEIHHPIRYFYVIIRVQIRMTSPSWATLPRGWTRSWKLSNLIRKTSCSAPRTSTAPSWTRPTRWWRRPTRTCCPSTFPEQSKPRTKSSTFSNRLLY